MSKWFAKRTKSYTPIDDNSAAGVGSSKQCDGSQHNLDDNMGMDDADQAPLDDNWVDEVDEVDEVFNKVSRTWEDRNNRALGHWNAIIPRLAKGLRGGAGYEKDCACSTMRSVLVIQLDGCSSWEIDFCDCSWAESLAAQGLFPGSQSCRGLHLMCTRSRFSQWQ